MYTIIGTVHDDPRGPHRLKRALQRFCPDIITLEASVESYSFDSVWDFYASKFELDPELIQELKEIEYCVQSFELGTVKEYAKESGCLVFPIDDFIEDELNVTDRALEGKLIRLEDKQTYIMKGIMHSNQTYAGLAFLLGRGLKESDDVGIGARDERTAKRWLEIQKANSDKSIVHVGGGKHLADDELNRTSYSRIKHLDIKRYLLDEF